MKNKFFNLAKKLSHRSEHPDHRLGAVIVKKNKVVSMGFNKIKTSPKSNHPFNMIHAELDAIFKSSEDLNGADIYIYRENKMGVPSCSKPCPTCESYIKNVGIRTVFYTDYGSFKEFVNV